jgi:DNA replication protein DnaC
VFHQELAQVARGRLVRLVPRLRRHRLQDRVLLRAVEAAYASREYAFVSEWSRVPVLFIDDLGNNRLTPSMESALFGVLNNRFAHVRPTVFTTQFLFKDLRKRFDNEKLAEALERRIAEHADVVFFRRQAPSTPNEKNQKAGQS